MISLLNVRRSTEKIPPLILSEGQSAQMHAQNLLVNCFTSEYDDQGLWPQLRYRLDDQQTHTIEQSVIISGHCDAPSRLEVPVEMNIAAADILLDFRHRTGLLSAKATHAQVGIAHNDNRIVMVVGYESRFLDIINPPVSFGTTDININALYIDNDLYDVPSQKFLSIKQEIAEGRNKPMVAIRHHPPLSSLNKAQLARTHCVPPSQIIAWVVPDRKPRHYGGNSTDLPYHPPVKQCPDPYTTNASLPPPANGAQSDALLSEAAVVYNNSSSPTWRRPVHLKASLWDVSETGINISFNLSALTEIWGPGVYIVSIMVDIGTRPGTEIATMPLLYKTVPSR